ncbi:MAG: hypothetical protein AAF682_20820 [Planctomycetota bacterium]
MRICAVLSSLAFFVLAPPALAQCPLAALAPDDPAKLIGLGFSIDTDGATLVVGAPFEAAPCIGGGECSQGAVYVFEPTPGGGWAQTQRLIAGDATPNEFFGRAVAVEGDTILVGAPNKTGSAAVCPFAVYGAVYVYERVDGDWVENQKLVPICQNGFFGQSIALDGDRALVGEPFADVGTTSSAGRAWVLERTASGWEFGPALWSTSPFFHAWFGWSVALEGDVAVVGAYNDVVFPAGTNSGAAYVFRSNGSAWQAEAQLLPSDGLSNADFGVSVAIDQGRILVGAPGAQLSTAPPSAAYVFEHGSGAWSETARLSPADPTDEGLFGWTVALDGDRAAIGAVNAEEQGRVSVFDLGPTGWTQTAQIAPPAPRPWSQFGNAVAVRGDRLFAGSLGLGSYEFSVSGSGCPSLFGAPGALTFEDGGVHELRLDAGPAYAGLAYVVLGSITGTAPGLPFAGFTLPLNPDFYLSFTWLNFNEPPLGDTLGLLDAQGRAEASFTLSVPTVDPILTGSTLHHAWFALDLTQPQPIAFVSNAASLALLP